MYVLYIPCHLPFKLTIKKFGEVITALIDCFKNFVYDFWDCKKTIHLKLHYCTDRKQAIPSKIWTAKSIKQVGKK
jgi:hypothetical protein